MDLTHLKNKDGFWWGVAAVLGAGSWIVPLHFRFGLTEGNALLLATACILVTGAVIGFLKPNRPWRWGIASVLLLPVAEIVMLTAGPIEKTEPTFSPLALLPYLLLKIPIYALIALPALLGAYVGAFAKQGTPKFVHLRASAKSWLWWGLAFLLGLLGGGIPILLTTDYEFKSGLLLTWMAVLFLFATIIGIAQPHRAWRWGIAVALGLPVAVILKIIIDSMQDPKLHNLFPFEIIIALFVAVPSSFAGTYFGALSRKLFNRNADTT